MIIVVMVGVISFGKHYLLTTKMVCLRVDIGLVGGDIFNLSRDFAVVVVEMEVEDLELEVGAVVKLV